MLQNIYVIIQKSNNNDDITHVSDLHSDEMYLFLEWKKYMTQRL